MRLLRFISFIFVIAVSTAYADSVQVECANSGGKAVISYKSDTDDKLKCAVECVFAPIDGPETKCSAQFDLTRSDTDIVAQECPLSEGTSELVQETKSCEKP